MPFRVRKSVKIAPGTRMNFSKSGISMSTKVFPGLYYSKKIADFKKMEKNGNGTPVKRKIPVSFRWWYVLIAVFFLIVGISMIGDGETGGGALGIIISFVMLLFTIINFCNYRNSLISPENKVDETEIK